MPAIREYINAERTLATRSMNWTKGLAANTTSTTALSELPPVADTTAALAALSGVIQTHGITWLGMQFFGTDAANETFVVEVWDLRSVSNGTSIERTLRCRATVTLGAATGISGGTVTASEFYADTIVVSVDRTVGTNATAISPAGDSRAELWLDVAGAPMVQVVLTLASSTAASANFLYTGF